MFIELTDHLRCPADHDESFLVLLPDRMENRSVIAGQLGCPVCGRTYELVDGIFIGGEPPRMDDDGTGVGAEALHALSGLAGPGGYMVLVGPVAALAPEMAALNPGVALVAVNPGAELPGGPEISVIQGGRIPLKSRSMRGVVLGRGYADDPFWVAEASRVVLPGLRIVGEGSNPPDDAIDLMASADRVWVGTTGRKSVSGKQKA